jgi:hypothetical protein
MSTPHSLYRSFVSFLFFVVVVVVSPNRFLFSILPSFIAATFGPRTVGRIHGTIFCVAAALGFIQYPAVTATTNDHNGDLFYMNLGMVILCAPIGILVEMLQRWDNRYQAIIAMAKDTTTDTKDVQLNVAVDSNELTLLRTELSAQRTIANERLTRYVDTIQRLRTALQSTHPRHHDDDTKANNSPPPQQADERTDDVGVLQRAIQHELDVYAPH